MPLIPDEWIERIKAEVPVVLLAERSGMTLKKAGPEVMGRCPFPPHEDSTPSLSINEARNVFQCFGCGVAGTSIDWVMREKGLQFRPAVELLLRDFFPSAAEELLDRAQRRGTRTSAPELPCPFHFEASDQELLNEYADHCHALFKESAEPRDFVTRRGLDSSELVSRFKLGYQDRTLGLRLPTPTTKAGVEIRERFKRLGLIRESGHGSFVGSLIVPTIDLSGNVTAIYARKTRDDLNKNHASPKHLYLRGDDDDVFNEEAFVASKEIILTEARIDALSFWRWGFRNVTACRGAGNFSQALLSAFVRHGIERCSIAFDRDERGDSGARKAAEKLMAHGIECFRVLFPKGMDANDVIRKMQPADKTLGLFLRSAEWMGNGHRPDGRQAVVVARAAEDALSSVAPATPPPDGTTSPAATPEEAAEKKNGPAAEEENRGAPMPDASASSCEAEIASPTSPVDRFAQGETHEASTPRSTDGPLVELKGENEAVFLFGDRRYRIRGLSRNTAFGVLKLNVLATREGLPLEGTPISGLHADTFDLYLSRARALFEKQASAELGVKDELVKRDLAAMLRRVEELQEKAVQKALEPKIRKILLTEDETAEAMELLKGPRLLDRIVSDLTLCGLVGEETNKLVCFIAAVSRLLDRPLAVIIQSSSAAGKTSLMEAILSMVPEESREKYTAVSGKSLFYFDEDISLSHKVLAIVEEEGAERATYPLKILQSEGELVMASTGKDPSTGKLVTKIYRVKGPVMILLATTAYELDPELENRCLRLTVDESREQTRRIHELQRMRQSVEGLMAERERDRIRALHRNAQRLLRPLHVLNPFQKDLTFIDDQTRTRRDHEKYLTLIESIALLHQYQRPIKHVTVGEDVVECVEVTLEDIAIANRLAADVLGRTLDELPPQTRRFLTLLHEKVKGTCEERDIARCDFRFSRKDARRWTGWSDTQVGIHMRRLVELEYVLVHRGGRGQSFVYELLWQGEGLDDRPFVLGLVDVETLRAKAGVPGTTPTSRSEEGEKTDSKRGQNGGVSGPNRGDQTSTSPSAGAAFPHSAAESPENAQLPAAPKSRSYVLRPFRRGVRLNLLRFPPGALAACATRRTAAR
jgi:DNA primase catalytic core